MTLGMLGWIGLGKAIVESVHQQGICNGLCPVSEKVPQVLQIIFTIIAVRRRIVTLRYYL